MKKTLFFVLLLIAVNIFLSGTPPASRSVGVIPFVPLSYLLVGFSFTVIGVLVIAFAHVFLAIREIALNTRSEKSTSKEKYGALMVICSIMRILGLIIIIAGWVIPLL